MEALAKKTWDKEAKRIEAAIKIEKMAKKNIKNAIKKKQNLKRKAALASTSGLFEKKKKKKLNNSPAKTPVKKADTANDQS